MEPADAIQTCPYDKSHRIRRSRMPYHLTVCSKNHPGVKVKRCNYDAGHVVRVEEFNKHESECPAKGVVSQPLDDENDTQEPPKILPIDADQGSDSWARGDWESETNCQSYSPLDAIQHRPIVHAKIGLSRAQRKKHRLQERKRFNEVTKGNAGENNDQPQSPSQS